jgi:hypothetical protein
MSAFFLTHACLPSFGRLLTRLHLMIHPLYHAQHPNRKLPIELIIHHLLQLLHEVPWFVSLGFAILIGRNKSLLRLLILGSLVPWGLMPWSLMPWSLILGGLIPWSLLLGQRSCAKICLSGHLFLDLWSLCLERGTLGSDMPTVVQILILASARIVCNIVYVQVRDRIHRELRCKN